MPREGFVPVDDDVRRVVEEGLDRTLFVEASAGTGKTHSLVGRLVGLVATGTATLDRVAAITFSEAAAAELRDRTRQGLERAAEDACRGDRERDRCRRGVRDLDQASIRTLHSFAASLLLERPLEAGLPPGFEVSDEVAAGIRFNEAWDGWLREALESGSDVARPLSLALALGVTLPALRTTALELHQSYGDLEGTSFGHVDLPEPRAAVDIAGSAGEIERLCRLAQLGEEDPLHAHATGRLGAMRRLAEARPGSVSYYSLLRRLMPLRCARGSQKNWNHDERSGENGCRLLKDLLGEMHVRASEEMDQVALAVAGPILGALRGFALGYADQRRRQGRAEFHDLLFWAHRMLRDRRDVRDHFRRRFTHILIDEAQDTDPVQAQMAMLLAGRVGEGEADRPLAWDEIEPEPGKLFVVGDPKQSIYRFRRADVAQMRRLQRRMEEAGGKTLTLAQNFRSHRSVTDWVNALFEDLMRGEEGEAGYVQADYEPMSPRWAEAAEGGVGPSVWALGNAEEDGGAEQVRRLEHTDIADLIAGIVGGNWLALDRDRTEVEGRETYRPVGYSDICVLVPTRSGLPNLEREIGGRGIPFRLESASLVFETQEVRDLLSFLRAADDPSDAVSVVAALRSAAFGCSDVELLRHHERHGRFDYLSGRGRGDDGPVAEGLTALRDYHRRRVWESPALLVDRFVRDRCLMAAAVGHPRMREQWRRYRFIIDRARRFSAAGGGSLRAFVRMLEDQIEERALVTEAPLPDSDEEAVRVMTVHGSKGLEFPVVILAGLGSGRRSGGQNVLVDRSSGRVEARVRSRDVVLETAGYGELAEHERRMEVAERVRLLYVAATRARDHLVLSLRRSAKSGGESASAAHQIAERMAGHPGLWREIEAVPPAAEGRPESGNERGPVPAAHTAEARDRWVEDRRRMVEELAALSSVAATSLGFLGDEEKPEQHSVEPWRRGRAATSIGRAVHAVLQDADLRTGADIPQQARVKASAEGVPGREEEIARLCRAAVGSDVVRRAIASGRMWREVPVAAPLGGLTLHGIIDLLFEEPDGLVVVDYKTDLVSAEDVEDAAARYRLQGGAYACAIGEVTGRAVKEVVFLYLQPAREERLWDLPRAVREAREAALLRLAPAG